MAKLTVFSGLPGAGKSTRAKAYVEAFGAVLISRDDLRTMFANLACEWSLTLAMAALARTLLTCGHSVAIDAPNLDPVDRALWHGVAAETGVPLDWVHVPTPVEECVRRDAQREHGIGADRIREFAAANAAGLQQIEAAA